MSLYTGLYRDTDKTRIFHSILDETQGAAYVGRNNYWHVYSCHMEVNTMPGLLY